MALCAARDAAVLKVVYAFGLRRTEASRLDVVDLRCNRKAAQFGEFGTVMVRFGKSPKGSPPKRRTVLLVPEMDWVVVTWQHVSAGDWTTLRRRRQPPAGPRGTLMLPQQISHRSAVIQIAPASSFQSTG